MKVGTLIRALSLLLVLPSATVLSLAGGIDRTMKAGLALFILGSMKTVMATDKTPVEDCAKNNPFMYCIATRGCKEDIIDQDMEFFTDHAITTDCKAILKMRPYSAKMYRVVLESRDPTVTEITLTRDGNPLFSCKVGSSQYKGNQIELLNAQGNLLKCEFIASETNSDILSSSSKELNMLANGELFWKATESDILKPEKYCNPVAASFDNANSDGYSVDKFVIGLTDLFCRPPYQLETRMLITSGSESVMETQFVKTTAIKCTAAKWTIEREGVPSVSIEKDKTFSYRCASKICTLCDYYPKAAENTLEIVDGAEGCKELKCKQNRLKVGDTVGDKAICKKNNDKPMWSLEGTWIEGSTSVECMGKKPCDTDKICEKSGDTKCAVDYVHGVPACTGKTHLTYQSKQIEKIYCDGDTGKWKYQFKDESPPPAELAEGVALSCTPDSEASGKEDPAAASMTTIAYVGGTIGALIAIAALIALVVCWRKKKYLFNARARNGKTGKSVETPNPKSSVNSKESKKEEQPAPASVLPPEYTARAPTLIIPDAKPTKYSDISESDSQAEAEYRKRKKQKKLRKKLLREKEKVEEEMREQDRQERALARKEKKNKVYEPEDHVDSKDDGFGPMMPDPVEGEVTQATQATGGTGPAAVAATQDTTTTKQK